MGKWRIVGYAAGGVVVAGVLGWALWPLTAPRVGNALEDRALSIIDTRLRTDPYLVSQPVASPWDCSENVIESRLRGDDVLVGLTASCDGGNSGYARVPMVFTLSPTPGGYEITHVDQAADGTGFEPSVERLFTSAGAAAVMRGR